MWPIDRGSFGHGGVLLFKLISNCIIMVTQEQIGREIIRMRKQMGLSQESFAFESGIDRRYVSDIENGKRNISFDVLTRIASFFGNSLSSFVFSAERNLFFDSICALERYLLESGEEICTFFSDPIYLTAIVGKSDDHRLVYSFQLMVEALCRAEHIGRQEATVRVESTIARELDDMKGREPIVLYGLK